MTNKILILGKNGQLGSRLSKIVGSSRAIGRLELDLNNVADIVDVLRSYPADIIVNATAYTKVDEAESCADDAYKVNAESVEKIAHYCRENNILMVSYSTDYVFSGEKKSPYVEDDLADPQNVYGKSKLQGEDAISNSGCRYLIFRTSWLYSEGDNNFFNSMLRLAKEREEMSVVCDQIGSPTYAGDLAKYSLLAIEKALQKDSFPNGVYHLCNQGYTSWYGFAEKIFEFYGMEKLKLKTLKAIKSSQYPTAATRPLNSRLDCAKIKSMLGVQMPNWQESLKRCIKERCE